ncbi:MAG: hypothetical protein R3F20_19520 [Planctomycetota bacterium]
MSKKKATLLIVLTLLCAYMNRGFILPEPEEASSDEDLVEYDEPLEQDRRDDESEEGSDRPGTDDRGDLGPEAEPATRIDDDAPSRSEDPDTETAVILASLSRRILQRSRLEALQVGTDDPEEIPVKPDEASKLREAEEERAGIEIEKRRAEEMARAQSEAAEARRLADARQALAQLKVHAILRSKTSAVARIDGRNLRAGDLVPGTTAVVRRIEARSVVLEHEGEEIVVELTHGKRVKRSMDDAADAASEEARVTPAPTIVDPEKSSEGGSK